MTRDLTLETLNKINLELHDSLSMAGTTTSIIEEVGTIVLVQVGPYRTVGRNSEGT